MDVHWFVDQTAYAPYLWCLRVELSLTLSTSWPLPSYFLSSYQSFLMLFCFFTTLGHSLNDISLFTRFLCSGLALHLLCSICIIIERIIMNMFLLWLGHDLHVTSPSLMHLLSSVLLLSTSYLTCKLVDRHQCLWWVWVLLCIPFRFVDQTTTH